MRIKGLLLVVLVLAMLTGCVESAQSKRNKFDACVINEMQGYWDVQKVWETTYENCPEPVKAKAGELTDICWGQQVLVERDVFVEPSADEAEATCVYLLE